MNSRRDLKKYEMPDAELEQTLNDFRSNVHAWSEAAYSQPHVRVKVYHSSSRVVAGWAMGCVLAVGSLSSALYEHHTREQAQIAAAAEAARQQKMEVEQRRQTEELAKIDGDVSREVPSAMEPLAQMMMEDSAQ